MGKRILGDSLNGLRIVLFWILMGFVAIGVSSAYREMHVDVTVADGIVGESIVAGRYSTEYSCIVNGSEVKLYDTASHAPGDRVLVVVRDGYPYAIVSSDKVDSYTSMPSRIMTASKRSPSCLPGTTSSSGISEGAGDSAGAEGGTVSVLTTDSLGCGAASRLPQPPSVASRTKASTEENTITSLFIPFFNSTIPFLFACRVPILLAGATANLRFRLRTRSLPNGSASWQALCSINSSILTGGLY